jgi:hypothetical protein
MTARFFDFAIRRMVDGLCVEELLTMPMPRRTAMVHAVGVLHKLRNKTQRTESVVQLVLLTPVSWGHQRMTVVAAWAWRDGKVRRL